MVFRTHEGDRNEMKKCLFGYIVTTALALCLGMASPVALRAEPFIVRDGQPCAGIIIAEAPSRATRLAAQELQTYIEKIAGARLTIGGKPAADMPIRIYVGQSPYTEELGITTAGLTCGAYRIVSGKNWLVFIGDDRDFTPIEPWPRGYDDIRSGKMQRAWDEITGKHWGYTHSQLHKHYSGSRALFGTPNEETFDRDGNVNVWTYDERGSFNAVCGFLRDLGVRWYMPGEIGEIVPAMDTIPLPQIDKTVRPDFPMRILNFRAGVYGLDAMMWGFRLGVRQPFGRQAAHGLQHMTHNEHTLTHYPEWFALYGGKRHTQLGQRLNQLCYSNEELLREAARFAQVQFDHYDMDVVSIMPPDGYTAMCQCKLCEGKDTPERGYRGLLSDYVWEFVNRVAKEVGKTHPGKLISNCAYGTYTDPPLTIDKLEPNLQVIIVGGRRPTSANRDDLRRLRDAWATKTDRPLEIFENYPFTGRGFYLPAYIPRVMGESINATKGMSRGEDVWLTMNFGENAIGYNHFLIYFTARMYWGGREQDAVAMFAEYCRLFYGPAAEKMRAFFAYCEDNWREMETDVDKTSHALGLFASAKGGADTESVHGRRIKLIDNYLNGLRSKSVQLAQKRGPVPVLRLVSGSRGNVVVDGKLDDRPWKECPVASTGRMRELQTGRQPIYGTSIKTAWIGSNLYVAIRCDEHPGEPLNIATTKNEDQAVWYGDAVEILLETESHSYYQIVVNPSGALIDLDRGAPKRAWFGWSSKAEVATHIAPDHWTVEIRIPVVQDENDPLHQVIGRHPTQSLPWHINLCRQRIRENGAEYSAFSPTGTAVFHEKMKFARFYAGLHRQFDADPTVTDYLIGSRAATDLARARKLDEALAAFVTLAAGEDVTDFQKADALEHAVGCARGLKNFARADELTEQIPIEAVAKVARMENLLARRQVDAVVKQFGTEDLSEWPFWQVGAGAFARAKAYVAAKAGERADADLRTALAYTSDIRLRTSILATMGSNRETNLKDDDAALAAYRQNVESERKIGAADEFRSVQGAARILTRKGKFEEALAMLGRVNIEKQKGFWRHALLLSLGETLSAADRKGEALAAYRKVMADGDALRHHREVAEKAVTSLESGRHVE